ncbi:MAG: hypothetical protein MJ196_04655 [Treponemataceae bacterium]|nr:hypothetical protein [Treponemataceae bacterium]
MQIFLTDINSKPFSLKIKPLFFRLLTVFALFFFALPAFGEQEVVLIKKNEYGGRTIQYEYQPGDRYYSQLVSSVYYFDASGSACRVIHYFNEQQSLLSGFSSQEERLENGMVLSYKMTLNAKQKAEQGIDYLIEYIGTDGNVVRKQFVKGELSLTETVGNFTDNYPLYSLEVLEKYLIEDDTQEIVVDKEVYKFSAQFNRGRSFATISSGQKNLSGKEKSLVNIYMDVYNQPNLAKLFVKKVELKVGKREYTAFVQEHLLPFVKKNNDCFISYSAVMYNGELCLLLTDVGLVD